MNNNIVTVIDVGSHKIAVAIATIDEDNKIKVIGESTYPSSGIKKGEITGIDEATNSISSALSIAERMAGISVSSAYVSINGRQIFSNNNKGVVAISDLEIIPEDVHRALEQAKTVAIPSSREIIHLIPRQFIVDQQNGIKVPIGMTGSRLEVDAHIISAPLTYIHNLEKCIQSLGLRIDSVVFTGWAASQSVLTSTEKELGVLLLDIGGGTVSVTTFEEDCVTYSTSIPLGGSNVTRDLAAGLRLSIEDAEKIKINSLELLKDAENKRKKKSITKQIDKVDKTQDSQYEETSTAIDMQLDEANLDVDVLDVSSLGIEGIKTVSKKLFLEITQARMDEIFRIIKESIEQAGYEYKLPGGIVLTGGGSKLPGLTTLAKEVFGVPARVGLPKGVEGLSDGISDSSYSVLQGMLLYSINDEIQRGETKFKSKSSPFKKSSDEGIGKIFSTIRKLIPF